MAKDDPQTLCDRLWETFLAPLVLGGTTRPGKPIGGKNALSIGDMRPPSDSVTLSLVDLARVRIARQLAPIDRFEQAPTATEWALAALLHDLVQATHPGFDAAFRRSGPKRILDVVDKTLQVLPSPVDTGDALSRHTWLSRMFALARTDIDLKWWTGSSMFLGTDPPARLTAWPEVRRVQQTKTPRLLMELPTSGSAVDPDRFAQVVQQLLQKTPLTDFATIDRAAPGFVWTHENLTFSSTRSGRTIALRALALLPDRVVDAALGGATRQLFASNAVRALMAAVDLLRERALGAATLRLQGDKDPEPLALGPEATDAAFAIGAGALAATHWIAQTGGGLGERERRAMLAVLTPAAQSPAAQEVRALLRA
jgi:hypothetical protein